MGGADLVHATTLERMKAAMESGCGLCGLMWTACYTRPASEEVRPSEYRFHLTIRAESATPGRFRSLSPGRVQYLDVDPEGGYAKRFYLYASPGEHAGLVIPSFSSN